MVKQSRIVKSLLLILLSIWVLPARPGFSSDQLPERENYTRLVSYMEKVRSASKSIGEADFVLEEKEYPLLEPYFNDSSFIVQSIALTLAEECAQASSSTLLLQQVVEKRLEKAFLSETSGGGTERMALCGLHLFENERFYSKKAQDLLEKQLRRAVEEYRKNKETRVESTLKDLIVCAGQARTKALSGLLGAIKKEFGDVFNDLDKKYTPVSRHMQNIECPWFNSVAWKAALARARIGSNEDLKFCIDLVDKFPDPEFRSLVLLRDLASIDRPELLEYYYRCLDRNESYAEPWGDRVRYGTAVMSAMLGRIDDDEIRKRVDVRLPDAIQQLKAYVQEKAGGDPTKLKFRYNRSLSECSMKSLKERRDSLRETHAVEAKNAQAENVPFVQ